MAVLISTVLQGAIAFAATNIDDVIVLMLFFSQVGPALKKRQIYCGQYLGFAAIVLCSLPGFFGGLILSDAWIGLLGFVPIALGIRSLLSPPDEEDEVQSVNLTTNPLLKFLSRFVDTQTLSVAAVTFANGGDNIATYISLFASLDLARLAIVLSVFFGLVAVWCRSADWLASHRAIAPVLSRYSHILVPFVLIGLGVYILIENESWKLIR